MLNQDAVRGSLQLLLILRQPTNVTASQISMCGNEFPAVTCQLFNLTVIFDQSTYIPYLVCAYEDHAIFGLSTKEIVVYSYTVREGVSFPRRIMIMYSEQNMLLDIIDKIQVNPIFPADYFEGLLESEINITELQLPLTKLMAFAEYGESEVSGLRQVCNGPP